MIEVGIDEAQRRLEELLDAVVAGNEVVITKGGSPVARLTALEPLREQRRTPGSAKGQIFMADDFDDPLPQEIQDAFEGRGEGQGHAGS